MTDLGASSQWSNLLQNLGAWQGSFTQISPDGTIEADSPSLVTLAGLNDNRTVRQTIQKFSSTGAVIYDRVLEYSSLNRGVLVFENGAFSQGSIQYGPFSEFGAELGFIDGDRRLRIVQLFDKASQLAKITLIREHRQDTSIAESLPPIQPPIQPLTPEQLVGEWQGESVTLYPDWRNPACYPTRLSVRLEGNQLHQSISAPGIELTSTAHVDGPILRFQQGRYPVQVLLLPDTAMLVPAWIGWLRQPVSRNKRSIAISRIRKACLLP
ncbi:DUF3598 family protein [Leptolyngbya sp. 7M]|uniref:DUF3598 family protein n=1 Tax=Leptolyngbya sp. 7M TaxID=2812896 RepID=UPI001B8D1378|nr:DUF3598 family protein [Leptolyngbya sp. 7M]QYO63006.1 DUF3598 family protein [Leptolyngbya sp. 7M]